MTPDLDASREDKVIDSTPPPQSGITGKRLLRIVMLSLLVVLGNVLFLELRVFWREWQEMRQEVRAVGVSAPIGFHNVYAHPSRAIKPVNWFRLEKDALYLWAGWEGNHHHWFKTGRDDLERRRLSEPISRDVVRSVNDPWVEIGGGSIWGKLSPESPVAGHSLSGVPTAYPLRLLSVMHIVNDVVEDRPYLAVLSGHQSAAQPIAIFDPRVDGNRITMGTSGYLLDGIPLLYDRETESLWSEEIDSLQAVSGRYKGNRLPLVARPSVVTWSVWKARNPRSRLLVGTHEAPVASSAGPKVTRITAGLEPAF